MGREVYFLRSVVDGDRLTNLASASNWWDEIDESQQCQDIIFYALSAAYALVALVALVQLIRIQLRVPEYGWTTQKIFHLMNFIVNGGSELEGAKDGRVIPRMVSTEFTGALVSNMSIFAFKSFDFRGLNRIKKSSAIGVLMEAKLGIPLNDAKEGNTECRVVAKKRKHR
ncbi:hypothetical protein KI387_030257, partial [Taxus chinensis]